MIYILGCSGMLGGYLIKEFPEAKHLYRKDFDILKDVVEVLNLANGDIIINAAGIIPQSGKTDYMKVNAEFPVTLGDYCKNVGAKMIHISTDCVFSGKKGFYIESDIPDSETEYGRSKALGDKAYATIIATSIIGEERFNKKSLLEWVISKKGEEIDGYTNHIWNGVTCRQLCNILKEIIKKKIFWEGRRHVFSPDPVSKYEMIQIISDAYDLNIKVMGILDKETKYMTLSSIYPPLFDIPNLRDQIYKLK